jgi:D-alanyl-lipoteichoic acid acyltransferase DltB (MBOAT superfamily)
MHKIAKYAIIINVILSLLFVVSNFVFDYFANMPSHHALWSPLWLTFYNYQAAATIGDIGVPEPNFSFYFFWASIAINLYSILKLSTEAKKQSQTNS